MKTQLKTQLKASLPMCALYPRAQVADDLKRESNGQKALLAKDLTKTVAQVTGPALFCSPSYKNQSALKFD